MVPVWHGVFYHSVERIQTKNRLSLSGLPPKPEAGACSHHCISILSIKPWTGRRHSETSWRGNEFLPLSMTVFVNNICSSRDSAIQVRAYVSLDKTALNALKR